MLAVTGTALTGSGMGAHGTVQRENFNWVAGEDLIKCYAQNESCDRFFCSVCGYYILSTHKLDPANYFLSLGCLELSQDIEIEYQQFVASKADWAKLDPYIPKHNSWPD